MIVSGRVQGVVFRGTTQEAARAHGVDGWVRNRWDGTVEAVFEGAPAAIDAMLDFCGRGPRWARVDALEVTEQPPESLRGFEIR